MAPPFALQTTSAVPGNRGARTRRPSAESREAGANGEQSVGSPRILRLGFYGEMSCFVPINQRVLSETDWGMAARLRPATVRSAKPGPGDQNSWLSGGGTP